MKRLTALLAATAAFAVTGTPPVFADRAQHTRLDAQFDGTLHWNADENPCGPYAAAVHEVRSGGYDLLTPPGGQQPGEIHVNGAVNGFMEIVPDDASLPTYTGSYREKVTGVFTRIDLENEGQDIERVSMFRLRIPLTGSDGSHLVLLLAGKVTRTASGDVAVQRFAQTCS